MIGRKPEASGCVLQYFTEFGRDSFAAYKPFVAGPQKIEGTINYIMTSIPAIASRNPTDSASESNSIRRVITRPAASITCFSRSFLVAIMKRTTASRAAQLTSHASPFDPSVTLFEADEADASLPATRRSKRSKVEPFTESDSDALRKTASEPLPEPALKGSRAVKSPSKAKVKAKASPSSPRKPKAIPQSLKTPHPAPENWKETYDAIKDMRARITAPVDTMGCDQAQHKEQDPKVCGPSAHCFFHGSRNVSEPAICDARLAHVIVTN